MQDNNPHADSILEVNLQNLVCNYGYLASLDGGDGDGDVGGGGFSAVVKADAYGLGLKAVATALYEKAGCKFFFVATLDEAVELRQILPQNDVRIAVFNGIRAGQGAIFLHHNITPVLNSLAEIQLYLDSQISANSRNLGGSCGGISGVSGGSANTGMEIGAGTEKGTDVPIIIHFDTGMNRLGIPVYEFDKEVFWQRLQKISRNIRGIGSRDDRVTQSSYNFNIEYALSHLSCADDDANPYNEMQMRNIRILKHYASEYFPDIKFSIANSAGVLSKKQEFESDLNRLGCGLYGINPFTNKQMDKKLKPVAFLSSRIIHLKKVPAGQAIGYGADFVTRRESLVAIIPVGYADFYPRNICDAEIAINGARAKIIGKISMDMVIADVSNISKIATGDKVEIMGENINVNEIAGKSGTIGYEILTKIGNRFKKLYT